MIMDKCREAFERHQAKLLNINYEDLKEQFDRHEKCFSKRYAAFSDFEKEFAIWEACWQSRQAEVDEKDKRIEEALKLIKAWSDQSYRDDAEQLIVDIEEALRGEHE
ncbi:hypothetical protein EXU29_12255 [Acinetobacter wuhouensis]|uniref:hypothetical protein n=1 Tax=Acinetobacter wuhouensis TaxID=1879050 RepID=UPI001022B197|nr:hypothetical protein [Acinetobacter wuhouensis]RZG71892.1 hypothetical protein EXU29_12255 [Acinetobacter wuhouensis]